MAVQLVLNFIIAVFWLFVTNSYTTNNFVLGFIFGLFLFTSYTECYQVDFMSSRYIVLLN